jgi:hypothetical protein
MEAIKESHRMIFAIFIWTFKVTQLRPGARVEMELDLSHRPEILAPELVGAWCPPSCSAGDNALSSLDFITSKAQVVFDFFFLLRRYLQNNPMHKATSSGNGIETVFTFSIGGGMTGSWLIAGSKNRSSSPPGHV